VFLASSLHAQIGETIVHSIGSKHFRGLKSWGGSFTNPSGRTHLRQMHPLRKSVLDYREAEQSRIFGPNRPRNTIQYGAEAENTIWGQSKTKQAEGNSENTSGTRGGGRSSAAPHHMVAAAMRWWFIMWAARIFSIGSACIFCFCLILCFSVFAPYCNFARLFYQFPCIRGYTLICIYIHCIYI